ncbi:MAG TPA: tetratricopeptide repeat protein, partial [Kofleriaceae bacterium]|nr:tetratricopeptide repeat protein [Kofleriaceae bacterium]
MSLRAPRSLAASLVVLSMLAAAPVRGESRADDEVALLVQEARLALDRGDYPRAGALLDRALAADPRQIHVYVLRASVHGVGQQYQRAVSVMRKARALAPDNLDVLTALGVHLVFAREYAEGVPLLEGVVARAPARYDAQAVLGLHYVRTRQWRRAIVALQAYLMARPEVLAREDARHRAHLAEAVLRSGEPKRARALYRQVLATDSKNERARLGLLWATAAIDCRHASTLAARLQDLAARYPAVILVQAQCALAEGAHARAESLAASYRARAPDDAQGWGIAGRLAQARGQTKLARDAFQRAAALAPRDPRWVYELARADRRAGNALGAARRLRAGTPSPALERAWTVELAWALVDLGQHEQATR